MKKKYIKPSSLIVYIESQGIICTSTPGVAGTGNLSPTIDNEETSEYLSRRNHDVWDAEEDGDQEW